jgi:hypothetical protein
VKVDVIDTLPRSGATIDDHAEAILRYRLIPGQLGGYKENVTEKFFISLLDIQKGRYVFARDDQDMDWGLGVDILKGDDRTVPIDDISLDITFDNAAKKTFTHLVTSFESPKSQKLSRSFSSSSGQ